MADDQTWHDWSNILDPIGVGGEGGIGNNNMWSKLNGTRPQTPGAGMFDQTAGQVAPGSAQQALGPDGNPQGQTRAMQMSLIQQLQDQAAGRGPSLAQMQLQQGTDRNISQAMALGQSQRGAGAAGMLKGIQGQQAGIAQGMAGDAAMLRLQEQMSAQQNLGNQLGSMRGADQQFAGMNMQNSQFNAGQANGMVSGNADRAAAAAQAQAKLDIEREKLLNDQASKSSPFGAVGGILAAFSDARLKTDVAPADDSLYAFLDKLGAHEYEYKDPAHGDRRVSPMAQELEQSELGKAFVFEAGPGKAVDYGKGFGTMLASQAALHKRLKKLEGK